MTATDKGTGKKQDIKITGASTLPSDEVERMVKDAEKNAEGERASQQASKRCLGHAGDHTCGGREAGWEQPEQNERAMGGGLGLPACHAACVHPSALSRLALRLGRTPPPTTPCLKHTPCLLRPPALPFAAAEDRKARDLIDTKNQADSLVYQTEKQLKEFADKVSGWQAIDVYILWGILGS